jgi:hypothetical protein
MHPNRWDARSRAALAEVARPRWGGDGWLSVCWAISIQAQGGVEHECSYLGLQQHAPIRVDGPVTGRGCASGLR